MKTLVTAALFGTAGWYAAHYVIEREDRGVCEYTHEIALNSSLTSGRKVVSFVLRNIKDRYSKRMANRQRWS